MPKVVGIRGVVTLRLRLAGDGVVDVQAVAGPPEYRQYAVDAAKHIKCQVPPNEEVTVHLDVNFAP